MASNFEGSIYKGSDLIDDYSCDICKENDINNKANFYCEKCSKFYCDNCVKLHNNMYKKHTVFGRDDLNKWPVAKAIAVALEQCHEHKGQKLKLFCEDHDQLLCTVCHVYSHQKCSQVVLVADKVQALQQNGEFKQLSATVGTLHEQLIQKKDDLKEGMQSLEKSYKTILEEINNLRKHINDYLDHLEQNTVTELDILLSAIRTSVQDDIQVCKQAIKEMNCAQDNMQGIYNKGEMLQFIMYRNCQDQSFQAESLLQGMATKKEVTMAFHPDTSFEQILSILSGLGKISRNVKQSPTETSTNQGVITRQSRTKAYGPVSSLSNQPDLRNETSDVNKPGMVSNPNQVMKVKSATEYSVKMEIDSETCWISGICDTVIGKLLITDMWNNRLKLLDENYTVLAHFDLPDKPWSMCSIDSSLVAVTVYYNKIHFIRVTNGQLVQDRTIKLQHSCRGIIHHNGSLYITSDTALYHYTVDGSLVSRIFEDNSSCYNVTSCAVSPDGDRIYVTSWARDQLITLSKDGTVISRLTDPKLQWNDVLPGLHVTDSGQVLVTGGDSNTILQVDRDGTKRLAEMVTWNDGVVRPTCVYFSKNTASIIVGMFDNENILVFKIQ